MGSLIQLPLLRLLQRSSAAASAVGQCGSQCGGQCSGPVQRVSAAGQVQWSRVVSIAVSDYSSWCSGRCSSQCSLLSCFPQPAHKHRAHHCTQLCTKHCAQPWGQHSVKKERLSFGPDPPSLVFSPRASATSNLNHSVPSCWPHRSTSMDSVQVICGWVHILPSA